MFCAPAVAIDDAAKTGFVIHAARASLAAMSGARAGTYKSWRDVVFALRWVANAADAEAKMLQACLDFDPVACTRAWKTAERRLAAGVRPSTHRTLRRLAMEDVAAAGGDPHA